MTRPVATWLVLVLVITATAVSVFSVPVAAPTPDARGGIAPAPADMGGTAAGEHQADAIQGADLGATQGFERDHTEFNITVLQNGSARWTFVYKKNLANESEKDEFRTFAADFNENETQLYQNFRDRASQLARQGSNVTDREMSAGNFQKDAYVAELTTGSDQGIVEMSFTWQNFAATDGDRVVVGDVFRGGLYLGQEQWMYFRPGPGIQFGDDVRPVPDGNESDSVPDSAWILYRGERQFADGRPHVAFVPQGTSPGTNGGPGNGTDPSGGFGILPMAVLALLILLGLGVAFAYRRGSVFGGRAGDGGADAAAVGGGPGDGGAGAASEPAVPDEELLSDEDRVLQLLDDHGGRMKQVNIVEETGWSKSKVSMLLSDMEDGDQISKLRVGRENIISLKGEEPDAAGSPFGEGE